mgnify:CR=1 FL=1
MQQEETQAGRREQTVRDQEALLQDKLSLTEQLLSKAQEKARDQAALEQRTLGERNLLSQQMAHLKEEKSRLKRKKRIFWREGQKSAGSWMRLKKSRKRVWIC